MSAIEAPDFTRVGLFLNPDVREAMDAEWRVCEGVIERLRADVESASARFVLLVMPLSVQVDAESIRYRRALGFTIDDRALGAREPNRRLADLCARASLNCVDALDAVKSGADRGERLFYPLDGHTTRAGYARIAGRVADAVLPWLETAPK